MTGVQLPVPPPTHQVPGSTSAGHGKRLPGWERTQGQCQAGRLIQQDGWHMPTSLEPTAWLSGEGGSYFFTSSPLLGYLLHLSEGRRAGPYGRSGRVPSRTVVRPSGHSDSLSFLL